ncbi:unnamed protein product [Periconia digitata]|uniref:CFEM domain-containing protein n=1 Tax=Periconia digitata TaxID=1303443 RepID=A0A9W4UFE7_9PLEO|nr:unnamed protein product [Periconia digitata]
MHLLSILTSLALLHGAFAQEELLQRLPLCANECLEATLPLSKCRADDLACLCTDTDFMGAAQLCNAGNCTVVETMSATNTTLAACGVPIKNKTGEMVGVTASFGALAVVMVAFRLIHRAASSKAQLGLDDLLIGLAGIASLFQNVPVVVAGCLGFGRDIWSIPPENLTASLKWMYVTYFTYQIAEFLCQLSILAFYLRIMTDPKTRRIVYGLAVFVVLFGLSNTFTMVLQCRPIPFFWNGWRGDTKGVCTVDVRLWGLIRGGIEISLDLAIIIVPLPMLSKLQMSFRKKVQIMSMFCVGFVITIVGCLRIWSLLAFDQSTNPTYDNVPGVYWCVTEANLFIVVACMPAIQAILQKAIPSCFTGFRKGTGYDSNGKYGSSSGLGKKGSFMEQSSRNMKGGITRSTNVDVYRTERTASDVELVDQHDWKQTQ